MSQKAGKGGSRPRDPVTPCGRSSGGAGSGGSGAKFRDRGGRKKDQPGSILVMISRADKPSIAISGAKVTLVGPGAGGARRQLTTDKQGAAEFKGLPAGDYTFSYVLPQEHLLANPHGDRLAIGEGGFDLAAVYVSPVGTLVVEVVDALSGLKVAPPCALQVTQSAQSVAWDDQLPGPQTFAKVKPGAYGFLASPDPTRYEPLLDGKAPAGAATVPAGGTGKVTIKLMPRTWIKFTVWDTRRNRPVDHATVKLQPNGGEAARSKPTDGVNLLEFAMAKKVTACTAVDVEVEGEEIYEVTGVGPA